MSEDKDIVKIVLHFEDGTTKEIIKGFLATVENDASNSTATITFDMVHMAGKDLPMIIDSILDLGVKIGMFGDSDESEDGEI